MRYTPFNYRNKKFISAKGGEGEIIMANLRGKGALQDVSIIFEIAGKNEKGAYVIAQIDQSLKNPDKVREGKSIADTNPHLNSREVEHPNGGTYVDHGKFYQQSQIDKMLAGAKEAKTADGKSFYGALVNLGINKDKEIYINTAKDIGPTKNPQFGANTLEKQEAVRAAARDYAAQKRAEKTKDVQAQAEAVEPTVEAPEAGMEQPEV